MDVVRTREPGGTPMAEQVRALLAEERSRDLNPSAVAMLLSSARSDHCQRLIGPALRRGAWVVSDRFVDSMFAYQVSGAGAPEALVRCMAANSVEGMMPDLTVICDVDVDTAHDRVVRRVRSAGVQLSRYEQADRSFRHRVRLGFHQRAALAAERCAVVDTEASKDTVAARIWSVICERLDVDDG